MCLEMLKELSYLGNWVGHGYKGVLGSNQRTPTLIFLAVRIFFLMHFLKCSPGGARDNPSTLGTNMKYGKGGLQWKKIHSEDENLPQWAYFLYEPINYILADPWIWGTLGYSVQAPEPPALQKDRKVVPALISPTLRCQAAIHLSCPQTAAHTLSSHCRVGREKMSASPPLLSTRLRRPALFTHQQLSKVTLVE